MEEARGDAGLNAERVAAVRRFADAFNRRDFDYFADRDAALSAAGLSQERIHEEAR